MQGPLHFELHTVDSVKSTNTSLKALAKEGAPEGYVLTALSQTNGRGRFNRVFFSPKDTGLYVSVLLRPTVPLSPAVLTCMSAVAVLETIESYRIPASIKWVNDVYVRGKKVVGILTEGAMRADGPLEYAVIGIGVNLFPPKDGFPESIRDHAGTVFEEAPDPALKNEFLKRLLQRIKLYYELLPETTFAETYRLKQLIYGCPILFGDGDRTLRGVAADIDADFRLIASCSDGTRHVLDRGDVTIL